MIKKLGGRQTGYLHPSDEESTSNKPGRNKHRSRNLQADLRKLILDQKRGNGRPARKAIPAARGDADYSYDLAIGGDITPPLTEKPNRRTHYAARTVTSGDGYFTFYVRPLKTTQFEDAFGETVNVVYQNE